MDRLLENHSNAEGACGTSNGHSNKPDLKTDIDISEEIERYLANLHNSNVEFIDPKLKRERQKLLDLLTSYKKLSDQLDKKCAEAAKLGLRVPNKEILARRAEIQALLHPEQYRNPRDEEKKKLVEKFSTKRLFTEVDKVCPPDLTPVHPVSDKRQIEKDRFCKLVASAPTRFNNILGDPSPRFKRLTRPSPSTPNYYADVRENEKERLARIFATSASFIRDPNLKRRILQRFKDKTRSSRLNTPEYTTSPDNIHRVEPEMCPGAQKLLHEGNTVSQLNSDLNEMVRIGEYSPLNKYTSPNRGRTVLGVGENDEKKKLLSKERHHEYLDFLEKERHDKAVMVSPPNERRSVSSASTQTDDSLSDGNGSPVQATAFKMTSPLPQFVGVSPREKLLSDLYGYRANNDVAQEEKSKRLAYAQALQEQIKEKKRLEEERRRKEKEEEDLEERRYKEQTERLQKEYDHERIQKLDLIFQRQAQEDFLRKKLAEMSLEAKELKKRERLSRLSDEREGSPEGSVSNYTNVAATQDALQVHQNSGRMSDRNGVGASSATVLPERLPEPQWDQDWSQIAGLEGVDLLREHRSQKERLQLPPVVDQSNKVDRRKIKSVGRPPYDGYVPSNVNDVMRRTQNYRQQAEAILKAPLDEEIMLPQEPSPPQRSAVSLPSPHRPRSPVLPAVRMESVLKRNSKILDNKWKVPQDGSHDLGRTIVDKDNILTQLGAFRRQLAQEHQKLEERIHGSSSS